MRLISVSKMKELEQKANAAGFSYAEMMLTAGSGIAEWIISRFGNSKNKYMIGLVGKGNNGGDTLIALGSLQKAGWTTRAMLVGERDAQDPLVIDYLSQGGTLLRIQDVEGIEQESIANGFILDGVYGTGFRLPLPESVAEIFKSVQLALPGFDWIAVDCPSGVDCETGDSSDGTQTAKWTLCLEAVKTGMLSESAFPYCGKLSVVDLGLTRYDPSLGETDDIVLDEHFVRKVLPQRPAFSHKGSYGKTLVAGGSVNFPGAPVLAGKAAYAVGTGLVQVAVPESIGQISPAGTPELTWLILEDGGGIISELAADTLSGHLSKAQSFVIGPGMGRETTTQKFISRLLLEGPVNQKSRVGFPGMTNRQVKIASSFAFPPTVIDADGLYHLSREAGWQDRCSAKLVLTPHPGEMATLTGLSVAEIQSERIRIAKEYAQKWNQVIVLKGALTVVAEPSGRAAIVPIATASLAKAGTGDVLSGMIGGLLAQAVEPWLAAAAGAYLHAQAGLLAEEMVGCSESVKASDVIRAIPRVYSSLKNIDLP